MRTSPRHCAATSRASALAAALFAAGCAQLGGPNLGTLPAPARATPAPAEIAASPCRYGDLARCVARCDDDDVGSCNAVGVLYEYGGQSEDDHARAAIFYLRACSADYPPACNNLAWLYAVGRGVPRDQARSLALFTRAYDGYRMACGHGDTAGCIEAADMLLEGRVDDDESAALALLETACTRGDRRDGSICATRRGESTGRCIPEWWGICHGWAPYAFTEPAAKSPVTKNGVTFYAGDLEALMSLVYASGGIQTKFLSKRCNKSQKSGSVQIDGTGRVIDGECRDMNPGSFHVTVANKLGLRKESFVYDRTYDAEVWNQPVRDFKVTNAVDGKLKEITKEEAIGLLGIGADTTNLLPKTTLAQGAKKAGTFTATRAGALHFVTKGTGDADLYVKKGGPASENTHDCESNGNTSTEECVVTVAAGDVVHYTLLGYANSEVELRVTVPAEGGGSDYTFNRDARRFFHVQMDFRFMAEPRNASRTPADLERYSALAQYEYILEADRAGRIMGGEWLGTSRTKHPDFIWWPTSKPTRAVANGLISYEEVKQLNDQAAGVAVRP